MICQMSCQQTIIWTKKTSRGMSNDGMTDTMGRMYPYRSITHMYTRERNLFSRRTISYGAADIKGI